MIIDAGYRYRFYTDSYSSQLYHWWRFDFFIICTSPYMNLSVGSAAASHARVVESSGTWLPPGLLLAAQYLLYLKQRGTRSSPLLRCGARWYGSPARAPVLPAVAASSKEGSLTSPRGLLPVVTDRLPPICARIPPITDAGTHSSSASSSSITSGVRRLFLKTSREIRDSCYH